MNTLIQPLPAPMKSDDARLLQTTPTSVELLDWSEMNPALRQTWRMLRKSQDEFVTPFFSLRFHDAVAEVRGDLSVAVIRDGNNNPIGFLPFHRLGRVAFPAGRYFNDAHNVMMRPETELDWLWFLDQCNLKSYDFHAKIGANYGLPAKYLQGSSESYSAHFGEDSIGFLESLEREHRTIQKQEQKSRKMSRELGPLRLEIECRCSEQLEQLIQWKRQQYRRTNILDLFTPSWTRELLRCLHQSTSDDARGILSVLWAGDQVVASHFGMIDDGLLHYWFPAYNPACSQYSPGTALFKEIVRSATDHGIECIDMGYGELPYKKKQTDTVTTVNYGCVSNSMAYLHWRRATKVVGLAIKKAPMKSQLKHLLRRIQPNAGISRIK